MQWNYAFDIGNENAVMVMRGIDGYLEIPAYAVYREERDEPIARGDKALEMYFRSGAEHITRCGMPLDAERMARFVMSLVRSHEKYASGSKNILLAVSPLAVYSSLQPLYRSLLELGADRVGIVPMDFACAAGTFADCLSGNACITLDVGASQVTLSCVCGGMRVELSRLEYGLNRCDDVIIERFRTKTGFVLGRQTARELKQTRTGKESVTVSAFSPAKGLPVRCEFPMELVSTALVELLKDAAELCDGMLSRLPCECAEDVLTRGIFVTGGGSGIFGIDKLLSEALELPIHTAQAGDKTAATGLKLILEDTNKYQVLITDEVSGGRRL